jgi:WD40 repeat protein
MARRPDGAVAVLNRDPRDAGIWLCDLGAGTARLLCRSPDFTLEGTVSSRGVWALTADIQYVTDAPPKQGKAAGGAGRADGTLVKDEYALWDAQKGGKLAALKPRETGAAGIPGVGHSLAFSPDESLVVSAPGNGIVTLWEITTQPETAAKPGAAAKPVLRTWTSADGRFTVEAELAADSGDKITLKKKSGAKVEISVAKLSREDRAYVEGLRAAPDK